jgi:hypothetical protein
VEFHNSTAGLYGFETPNTNIAYFFLKVEMIVKNAVFWDVTSVGYCKNRRFGRK